MAYAIITGASKGIGKSIAEQLALRGYDLLIIARTENLLSALADAVKTKTGRDVRWLAMDLTQENEIEKIVDYVRRENLPVKVLVNNAGYGVWGRFDELSWERQNDMMKVNIDCMVHLTHSMLPFLIKNKPAFILNIASTAAYQAVPTLSVYAASKSFVLLFSRGLRHELKNSDVSVTCLSPGPTDTNFMQAAGITKPHMIKRAAKFNMTPEDVARIAVKGLFNRKIEIVPGALNRISVWLTYFTPKLLAEKIAADLYK